jgi:predicted ATP-grasp superfamily ATP-dependent carboligase
MQTSPQLDASLPALIFKAGYYPVHHGSAGIIRTLGRLKVPVYAVVEDDFTPAAMSRFLSGKFVWNTEALDRDALVEGLVRIAQKIGRAVLIPTDDIAAAFMAEEGDALRELYAFPRAPRKLAGELANKRRLYQICRQYSIPCPAAVFPASIAEVQAFVERAAFPVVMKAAESQRTPAGLRSTSIARSPGELIALYEQAPAGANLILQEYIPESCSEDWIYHGYTNPESGCMLGFTGRKLRSYPPFAGPTSLGVSARNETLRRQSEALLNAIGYAGIMDLDYRFDRRDGQYKLLDFNPRIGANFRMFESAAGIDVVRAMHLDMSGRPVPHDPAVDGKVFVVESYDPFAAIGYIRRGAITLGDWWRSMKGPKELAWLSFDDPLPFPVMCGRLLGRSLKRIIPRPTTAQAPPREPLFKPAAREAAAAASVHDVER